MTRAPSSCGTCTVSLHPRAGPGSHTRLPQSPRTQPFGYGTPRTSNPQHPPSWGPPWRNLGARPGRSEEACLAHTCQGCGGGQSGWDSVPREPSRCPHSSQETWSGSCGRTNISAVQGALHPHRAGPQPHITTGKAYIWEVVKPGPWALPWSQARVGTVSLAQA